MKAAEVLRTARLNRGLTQRELAKKCQVSQPAIARIESAVEDATLERLNGLLQPLGSKVTLVPFRTSTVYETAAFIRHDVSAGEFLHAFRSIIQLNDDIERADPATRVALCLTPPNATGDMRFDALIAGLVEYKLESAQLPKPLWVSDLRFFLENPWDLEQVPQLQERARLCTPEQFSRHGVFIDAVNFASV
jgi:transcriptional regulator with XRE-family HTH domain